MTTREIRANVVNAADLSAGAVTAPKLASGAVTTRSIAGGAVRADDIATGAVRSADIADGGVTTSKLASKSVNAAKLDVPYTSVVKFSPVIESGSSGYRNVRATCPANHRIVSGGGGWVAPDSTAPIEAASYVSGSRPFPPSSSADQQNEWEVYGLDNSTGTRRLMAIAICIPKS